MCSLLSSRYIPSSRLNLATTSGQHKRPGSSSCDFVLVDCNSWSSCWRDSDIDRMAEEAKKVEVEVAPPPTPEPTKDIAEEKAVVPAPEESTALVVVENAEKPAATGGSHERDAFLARVATEKRISLIKAWEESEKAKAENKAAKRLANVTSWENSKIAQMEAELKTMHEQLERKKAEYAEKLKNSAAMVHKTAEEMRAAAVAKRGEAIVKAEETSAKYRAKGEAPKKLFGVFSRG